MDHNIYCIFCRRFIGKAEYVFNGQLIKCKGCRAQIKIDSSVNKWERGSAPNAGIAFKLGVSGVVDKKIDE